MPVSKPTKSSQTPSGPQWMHAERTNLWTLSIGGFFYLSVYYVADKWHTVQIRDVFPNLCCIRMHFSSPDIYSALLLFKKKQLNKRQIAIAIMFKKFNEKYRKKTTTKNTTKPEYLNRIAIDLHV